MIVSEQYVGRRGNLYRDVKLYTTKASPIGYRDRVERIEEALPISCNKVI